MPASPLHTPLLPSVTASTTPLSPVARGTGGPARASAFFELAMQTETNNVPCGCSSVVVVTGPRHLLRCTIAQLSSML